MRNILLSGIAVSFFLVLSLFNHWEPTHETWGYWTFAGILAETGEFIIPDRSPVYVSYLLFFRRLPFPTSIVTEYLLTAALTIAALIMLFTQYLGYWGAVVGAILWIPFLQWAEPPTQKLALAGSCLAIAFRQKINDKKFAIVVFYSVLIVCYLLRSTYLYFLLFFLVWDSIEWVQSVRHPRFNRGSTHLKLDSRFHGNDKQSILTVLFKKLVLFWPLLLVFGFYLLVLLRQSPSPWNTVHFGSVTWLPISGKRFELLQEYNARYMQNRYGTMVDHDYYLTNRELFAGARTSWEAVQANPGFIMDALQQFVVDGILLASYLTIAFEQFLVLSDWEYRYVAVICTLLLISYGAVIYGALRSAGTNRLLRGFIWGNILLLAVSVVYRPHMRYMLPAIPPLLLAGSWYGKQIARSVNLSTVTIAFMLCIFSNGLPLWERSLRMFRQDMLRRDLRLLQNRPAGPVISLTASLPTFRALLPRCRAMMLHEQTFIAAFTHVPVDTIYHTGEIPPFGDLEHGAYSWLHPDRINCLFVSRELMESDGPTNPRLRYASYIKPYEELLLQRGAQSYDIPAYGRAVILSR